MIVPPDVILSYIQYTLWPFNLVMWTGMPLIIFLGTTLFHIIVWLIAEDVGNHWDFWLGQPLASLASILLATLLQYVLPNPIQQPTLK